MNERIEDLKKDLDNLINENAEYKVIYDLSTKLDELIVKYYKEELNIRSIEKCK
jgi:hypothetical protein